MFQLSYVAIYTLMNFLFSYKVNEINLDISEINFKLLEINYNV